MLYLIIILDLIIYNNELDLKQFGLNNRFIAQNFGKFLSKEKIRFPFSKQLS